MEKWNLDFQYVHYVNDLVSAFSKHQLFLICDTCSKDFIKSLWFYLLYNLFPECLIYHFICINPIFRERQTTGCCSGSNEGGTRITNGCRQSEGCTEEKKVVDISDSI